MRLGVVPRSDVFGRPSAQQIFIQAASTYFPPWILEWMTDHGPGTRLERAREVKKMATEVAKEMVREKAETLLEGKGSRDVFSLLGRRYFHCSPTLLTLSQSRPIWTLKQRTG